MTLITEIVIFERISATPVDRTDLAVIEEQYVENSRRLISRQLTDVRSKVALNVAPITR